MRQGKRSAAGFTRVAPPETHYPTDAAGILLDRQRILTDGHENLFHALCLVIPRTSPTSDHEAPSRLAASTASRKSRSVEIERSWISFTLRSRDERRDSLSEPGECSCPTQRVYVAGVTHQLPRKRPHGHPSQTLDHNSILRRHHRLRKRALMGRDLSGWRLEDPQLSPLPRARDRDPSVTIVLTLAACRGHEHPEYFWPTSFRGQITDESQRQRAEAIKCCNHCPVRTQCGEYAQSMPGTTGVWGGEYLGVRSGYEHRRTRLTDKSGPNCNKEIHPHWGPCAVLDRAVVPDESVVSLSYVPVSSRGGPRGALADARTSPQNHPHGDPGPSHRTLSDLDTELLADALAASEETFEDDWDDWDNDG